MRSWLPLLLAAGLCACDRLPGGHGNESGAAAEDPTANLQVVDRNADPAHIRDLIARAMPAALGGARDPRYANLRAGVGGAACGEVSAAGEPARPFIVTPDAVAIVAEAPKLRFADPGDFAADAWVRWCATPEELAAIQAEIKRAAADPANIAMAATADAAAGAEPAQAPPPEAAPEPPAPRS
ncbi:MAG: hypothetical protein ACJ8DZ_06580, partial [Allosphingosinicella sp.]